MNLGVGADVVEIMRASPFAAVSVVSLGALVLCVVPVHQRAAKAAPASLTSEQIDEHIASVPPAGDVVIPLRSGGHSDDDYWQGDTVSRAINATCMARLLTPDQWELLIDRSALVTMRERWLVNETLTVRVGYPRWAGPRGSVRITPFGRGATTIEVVPSWQGSDDNGYDWCTWMHHVIAGTPELTDTFAQFDVDVVVRNDSREPGIAWSTRISRRLQMEPDVAKVMTPVCGPDIDNAVHRSIRLETTRDTVSGPVYLCAVANLHGTCLPFTARMAMPITLEVLDESGRAQHSWGFDLNRDALQNCMGRSVECADETFDSAVDRTRWSIRVRGDGVAAIHDLRFDSYRSGEIAIPFNEIFRPE